MGIECCPRDGVGCAESGEPLSAAQDFGLPTVLRALIGRIPYGGNIINAMDMIEQLMPDSNGNTLWLEDYDTPFWGRHSIADSVIPSMQRMHDRLYG